MALCKCGCGQTTNLAPYHCRSKGWIEGQPLKFVRGHQARMSRFAKYPQLYEVRDCGHTTPCWVWMRSTSDAGYGRYMVRLNGVAKLCQAHRFMYEKHKGAIPEGMDLDHLCHKRSCVNPDHLQPVPGRINYQRAAWHASGKCCPACQRPF